MAATLEHHETEHEARSGTPSRHRIHLFDRRVELHEMPDLSKEAPEVEYGQPKRTWPRYLALGVTVGAIGLAGVAISGIVGDDAGSDTLAGYSQAYLRPDAPTWWTGEAIASPDHLVTTPANLQAQTLEMYSQPYLRPDAISTAPVGAEATTLADYSQAYVRPDAPVGGGSDTLADYSQPYQRPDAPTG